MSQQKIFNPFEMWKDFYNQTITNLDENMNVESTSKVMGQVLEMNLLYKKMLNETTERYFEQVNLPTRNDLANISSLIVNVDSKVDDLEDLIEETKSNQLNQAELNLEMIDVKNKIKNLDAKLNLILSLLKKDNEELKTDKLANIQEKAEIKQEQISNK
jgi:polyhydroxyalkanoic acid synthase PhaR subunit